MNFTAFETRHALAEALATQVLQTVRRKPSLVVSGGSTPLDFFKALKPKIADLALTITLADERCVSPDHPDSNEKQVREELLSSHHQFLSLLKPDISTSLQTANLPWGAVVLGMGEDGHTASLFPHHPDLSAALETKQYTLAVRGAPKPPPERITLTPACLLSAQHLFVHITGDAKRAVLEQAMQPGPIADYPVRVFLQQTKTPLAVYWAP